MPGLAARLPTEAEWERACRAGSTTATRLGNLVILGDHNAPPLNAIAWYGDNSGQEVDVGDEGYNSSEWPEKESLRRLVGTHPVAKKAPNPLGLFDMLGNVWEWCEDWYGQYGAQSATDPRGPRTGSYRVGRGGAWLTYAAAVRAAFRNAYIPTTRDGSLGFRLARNGGDPAKGGEPRKAGERIPRPGAAGGERKSPAPEPSIRT